MSYTKKPRKTAIFDFDMTICDSSWTEKHLQECNDSYVEVYKKYGNNDSVISEMRELLDTLFFDGYKIVILSARLENSRQIMIDWFIKHKFYHYKTFDIYLASSEWANKIKKNPAPVKKHMFMEYIKNNDEYDVKLVFDDNEQNIEMFKTLGITCLTVHPTKRKKKANKKEN